MFLCGIALFKILDLDPGFSDIVGVLAGEEAPPAVWAVFYEGKMIAVYLTPDGAYARMLNVIEGIQRGQLPVVQTLAEAELIRDRALESSSRTPASLARAPRFGDSSLDPQP